MATIKYLDDNVVFANFSCEECDTHEAVTIPFMAECGSPVCTDCDNEMLYQHLTEHVKAVSAAN